MLELMPQWLGHALKGVRAGHEKLAIAKLGVGNRSLDLTSPAFHSGGPLPVWCTADGEGMSPPLDWAAGEAPGGCALIVEDPDAPTPEPLVHAIVWNLAGGTGTLPRGAIAPKGGADTGTNSYGRTGWLPPDPPTGHGSHDYIFQLFALTEPLPLEPEPGRAALLDALGGRIAAAGVLIGTYERGEAVAAPAGPALAT